jgi:hypothetical protein
MGMNFQEFLHSKGWHYSVKHKCLHSYPKRIWFNEDLNMFYSEKGEVLTGLLIAFLQHAKNANYFLVNKVDIHKSIEEFNSKCLNFIYKQGFFGELTEMEVVQDEERIVITDDLSSFEKEISQKHYNQRRLI